MSVLGWYDGDGYNKAITAIEWFTRAITKLAREEYTISEYQNEAIKFIETLIKPNGTGLH
jgi:hypothetical protein